MKFEGLIAVRYLFAGLRRHSAARSRSVVTVISWISLIGLLVSTAALIVVLSVYNGIGDITKNLFGTFDPELVVVPTEGKTFRTSTLETPCCTTAPISSATPPLPTPPSIICLSEAKCSTRWG